MNKEDAKRRLKVIELESQRLQEMIDVPEKPKLRHGDFGINNLGYPRLILQFENKELFDAGILYCDAVSDDYTHPLPDPILGNVFDLMKGWDKPFEKWGDDRASKGIKIVRNRIEFYACTNGCCSKSHSPCSENAEEFHNALGHAIADLKRKK